MTTLTIIVASGGALNISSHRSYRTFQRTKDLILTISFCLRCIRRQPKEFYMNRVALLSTCHMYIWRHHHHLLYTTLENIIHNLMLCSTLDNISASFSCSGASLNTSTPHIHRVASTPDHRYHRQLGALDVPDHIVPSHVRQASAPFVDLS